MSYMEYAKKLTEILGLTTPPVAVKFLKPGDPIPAGFSMPTKKMRFCQAVMEAGWGNMLNIVPTELSCGPGPSYFGAPIKEKVAKGEAHFGLGLFGSPDAATKNLNANVRVIPGSVASAVVGPLEKFPIQADAVILRTNSEQTMWIIHSRSFAEGKHLTIEVQTEASVCSGTSIACYLRNEVQIGFGCFGCRSNTDIGFTDILVGIPTSILATVVETLEKLRQPIAVSRAKAAFYTTYPEKKPTTV